MTSNNILKDSNDCNIKSDNLHNKVKFFSDTYNYNSDFDINSITAKEFHDFVALEEEKKREKQLIGKLEKGGYSVKTEKELTEINLQTLEFETIECKRNLMLLPSVARRIQAERRKQLKAFILENGLSKRLHCLTSSLSICKLDEIRSERKNSMRTLEQIRTQLKKYGFEVIFTPIELSFFQDKYSDEMLCNLHCHLLLVRQPNSKIKKVLDYLHKGKKRKLRNPYVEQISEEDVEKTLSYVTKTQDNDRDLTPEELATVAQQIEGLKLYEPAGKFREYVSKLNRNKQRIEIEGDKVIKLDHSEKRPLKPVKKAGDSNRILRLTRPKFCGNSPEKAPCVVVDGFTNIEDFIQDPINQNILSKLTYYKNKVMGIPGSNKPTQEKSSINSIPIHEITDEIPF